jgi:hypothetical protein
MKLNKKKPIFKKMINLIKNKEVKILARNKNQVSKIKADLKIKNYKIKNKVTRTFSHHNRNLMKCHLWLKMNLLNISKNQKIINYFLYFNCLYNVRIKLIDYNYNI